MCDLVTFTADQPKPWLNIFCNEVHAALLDADDLKVDTLTTGAITNTGNITTATLDATTVTADNGDFDSTTANTSTVNTLTITANSNSDGSPTFRNSFKTPGDVLITGTTGISVANSWLSGLPQFAPGVLRIGSIIETTLDGLVQTAAINRTINIIFPWHIFQVQIPPVAGVPSPTWIMVRHCILVPGSAGFIRSSLLFFRNGLFEGQDSVTTGPIDTDIIYDPKISWATAEAGNIYTSITATIMLTR